jgi:hypothetical protein
MAGGCIAMRYPQDRRSSPGRTFLRVTPQFRLLLAARNPAGLQKASGPKAGLEKAKWQQRTTAAEIGCIPRAGAG